MALSLNLPPFLAVAPRASIDGHESVSDQVHFKLGTFSAAFLPPAALFTALFRRLL